MARVRDSSAVVLGMLILSGAGPPAEDNEAQILKDGVGQAFRGAGDVFPWLALCILAAFLAALFVAWVFCRVPEFTRRKRNSPTISEDDRDPETGRYRV